MTSGIRALEVVDDIERAAGKPVITSDQAQGCLRRAGVTDAIDGFGRIFRREGRALLPRGSRDWLISRKGAVRNERNIYHCRSESFAAQ